MSVVPVDSDSDDIDTDESSSDEGPRRKVVVDVYAWHELHTRNTPSLTHRCQQIFDILSGIRLTHQREISHAKTRIMQLLDMLERTAWMDWAQPKLSQLSSTLDEILPIVEGLIDVFKSRAEDNIRHLLKEAESLMTDVVEDDEIGFCAAIGIDDPQTIAFWSAQPFGHRREVDLAQFEKSVALALKQGKLWACSLGHFAAQTVAKAVRQSIVEQCKLGRQQTISFQDLYDWVCLGPGDLAVMHVLSGVRGAAVLNKGKSLHTLGERVGELCQRDIHEGLSEMFAQCNGPQWQRHEHWLEGERVDLWQGVSSNQFGAIYALDLDRNGLSNGVGGLHSSQLPLYVLQYGSLTRLDLSFNQLDGALPAELGGPHLAPRLRELIVHNNNLCGRLPPALVTSTSLRGLYAHNNRFAGILPAVWKAPQLAHVHLFNNRFSGTLPTAFSGNGLPNLCSLRLGGNQLSGVIPDALCTCTSLTTLQLDRNKFRGVLPATLVQLRELQYLDLSTNEFNGELPVDIIELQRNWRKLRTAKLKQSGFRVPIVRAFDEWLAIMQGVPTDSEGMARAAAAVAGAAAAALWAASAAHMALKESEKQIAKARKPRRSSNVGFRAAGLLGRAARRMSAPVILRRISQIGSKAVGIVAKAARRMSTVVRTDGADLEAVQARAAKLKAGAVVVAAGATGS